MSAHQRSQGELAFACAYYPRTGIFTPPVTTALELSAITFAPSDPVVITTGGTKLHGEARGCTKGDLEALLVASY